jgi:hypothetical protein
MNHNPFQLNRERNIMSKISKREMKNIKKRKQQREIMNMKKESNMSARIFPIGPREVTNPYSNVSNSRLFYLELVNDLYIKSFSDFLSYCSAVCATMFSKDDIRESLQNSSSVPEFEFAYQRPADRLKFSAMTPDCSLLTFEHLDAVNAEDRYFSCDVLAVVSCDNQTVYISPSRFIYVEDTLNPERSFVYYCD